MFTKKTLSPLATFVLFASFAIFTILLGQVIPIELAVMAPAVIPAAVKLDTLQQCRDAVADYQGRCQKFWEQATEAYDMTLVTMFEGVTDSKDKLDKYTELEDVTKQIVEVAKKFEGIEAARQLSIERDRIQKGAGGGTQITPPGPGGAGGGSQAPKGLGDIFIESPAYQGYKDSAANGGTKAMNVEYRVADEVDAYGLKTLFQTTNGWAPETTRTGVVVPFATRPIEVTDIFPAGNTSQNAIVYMEETTFTNNAAEIAEAALYPEGALKLTEQSSPVRKIGVWLPVTDEQLEDEPQAASYLNQRLPFMVRQRLDQQTLLGDGVAPNLLGVLNKPGIQTQARAADTNEDAIYKAMVLVRTTGQAMPSHIILNPTNWQTIRLRKTADGQYIFGDPASRGAITLWGLPVVEAQVITLNTGLVGDFPNFSQLAMRRGMDVQITNAHADFFINGKQAIRADLRVALVLFRPAAFCSVTGLD